jgi:hypothetical protein
LQWEAIRRLMTSTTPEDRPMHLLPSHAIPGMLEIRPDPHVDVMALEVGFSEGTPETRLPNLHTLGCALDAAKDPGCLQLLFEVCT